MAYITQPLTISCADCSQLQCSAARQYVWTLYYER